MPVLPAGIDDPRDVAAIDEIEQQVVAFHEPTRAAGIVDGCEPPAAALILAQLDAGQGNTVVQIDARASIDLAKRIALDAHLKIGEVIAQAAAAAAPVPVLFVRLASPLLQRPQVGRVFGVQLGDFRFRRVFCPAVTEPLLVEALQSLMLDPQLVIAGVRMLATRSGGAIAFEFAALIDAALAAIDPLDGISDRLTDAVPFGPLAAAGDPSA